MRKIQSSKIILVTSVLLAIVGVFSACKKNDDKRTECRTKTLISPSSNDTIFVSYNSEGKVSSIIGDYGISNSASYSYSDNSITIIRRNSGAFVERTVVTLNAAGLATNVKTENNITGTDWINTAYEYNGEELFRSTVTYSDGSSPTITTYAWLNQNMVSNTSNSSNATFEYYTDKPRQDGDYLTVVQLLQGYEVFRTKNLFKSFAGIVFTYGFRSDGKISSISQVAGNTTSVLFNYDYECN